MSSPPGSVLWTKPQKGQLLRWSLGDQPLQGPAPAPTSPPRAPPPPPHPTPCPQPRLVITQQLFTTLLLVIRVGFVTWAGTGLLWGLAQHGQTEASPTPMSSPSHTPSLSPSQSPSQSRSNHANPPNQQPYSGGSVPAPSPSPTRGSSSRPPSHPPTPNASQPSSRASSLNPSPHMQHVPRGPVPNPTPPASKSPSQSGLKPVSRNSSQTPTVPLAKSPATSGSYIGPIRDIPFCIAPYVPRFLKEPPFFQPPTSPLPLNHCLPCPTCEHTPPREHPSPRESFYFPLLPPPPPHHRDRCLYPTPPSLFTPPCSLTYTPPVDVLVRAKPHVVPSALPATFYTPFSRYYAQPRPYRPLARRRPSPFSDGTGRSLHFSK